MPETKKPDELAQFASDLQLMRHCAINLRLNATGQRLDWAIRMVAFEIAGDYEGCSRYEAAQAAPTKFQTVISANGRDLVLVEGVVKKIGLHKAHTSCPDCGSTEREMRNYGRSWDEADTHCAKCGKLIRRFDAA